MCHDRGTDRAMRFSSEGEPLILPSGLRFVAQGSGCVCVRHPPQPHARPPHLVVRLPGLSFDVSVPFTAADAVVFRFIYLLYCHRWTRPVTDSVCCILSQGMDGVVMVTTAFPPDTHTHINQQGVRCKTPVTFMCASLRGCRVRVRGGGVG